MTATINIETVCAWSDPKELTTRAGPRLLRTAKPTEEFWKLWRADKAAAKAAGLSCSKSRETGAWQACWWAEVQRDEQAIAESKRAALDADLPRPEGLDYLPYQKAGIVTMAGRDHTLLADEMGLGKTIQALGVINFRPEIKRVLVICPASLKGNWAREARKWLVNRELADSINVISGTKRQAFGMGDTEFAIINYDILAAHEVALKSGVAMPEFEWDMMICDESHNLKSGKAARTRHVLGYWSDKIDPIPAKRKMFLTGTPVLNRPIEMWSTLSALAPNQFPNWRGFVNRYCAGEARTGASNLGELSDRLRQSIMVRRLKEDVLTELPPKRRQIIRIEDDSAAIRKVRQEESKVLAELADAASDEAKRFPFEEIARIRRMTGDAKAPHVISHLREVFDGGAQKIVCFAHHISVMDAIEDAMRKAGVHVCRIDGSVDPAKRQAIVDDFQNSKPPALFVGQIKAAGVGITLTASSHVVFAELPWTPAELTQAEDRCHRIGQASSVLAQSVVIPDSLDARMAEILMEKAAIVHSAMDSAGEWGQGAMIREIVVPGTGDSPAREKREFHADDALRATMVRAIRQLAAMDPDHAAELNGVGFSSWTGPIGHRLAREDDFSPRQAWWARKLIIHHRRQVPAAAAAIDAAAA